MSKLYSVNDRGLLNPAGRKPLAAHKTYFEQVTRVHSCKEIAPNGWALRVPALRQRDRRSCQSQLQAEHRRPIEARHLERSARDGSCG